MKNLIYKILETHSCYFPRVATFLSLSSLRSQLHRRISHFIVISQPCASHLATASLTSSLYLSLSHILSSLAFDEVNSEHDSVR